MAELECLRHEFSVGVAVPLRNLSLSPALFLLMQAKLARKPSRAARPQDSAAAVEFVLQELKRRTLQRQQYAVLIKAELRYALDMC